VTSSDSTWGADESNAVISRYQTRFEQYGHSEQSLGWGKKGRQRLRFQILASQWDLRARSVLDLGAGFGDFYAFSKPLGISSYLGIDITPSLVTQGNQIYGLESDFTLRLGSVTDEEQYSLSDIVIISGLFNFRLGNGRNTEFIIQVLKSAFKFARLGVACNFITDRVDFREPHIHYQSPAEALEIACQLSRNVALRQDYMPFEYSLFIDRRDLFTSESAVFSHL